MSEDTRIIRRQSADHVAKRAASMRGQKRPNYTRPTEPTEKQLASYAQARNLPPAPCPNGCGFEAKGARHLGKHLKRCGSPCVVTGCEETMHHSLGLCATHYTVHKNVKAYGLTVWSYLDLYEQHRGQCDVCELKGEHKGQKLATGAGSKNLVLCVDHDHDTGRTRGLLCHSCNVAIGLMRDDPTRLRSAAAYLEANLSSIAAS